MLPSSSSTSAPPPDAQPLILCSEDVRAPACWHPTSQNSRNTHLALGCNNWHLIQLLDTPLIIKYFCPIIGYPVFRLAGIPKVSEFRRKIDVFGAPLYGPETSPLWKFSLDEHSVSEILTSIWAGFSLDLGPCFFTLIMHPLKVSFDRERLPSDR